MNLDYQAKAAFNKILRIGIKTKGRTNTDRIRLLSGVKFTYNCSDGKMSAFTLRRNNPDLAIAETMAFLMGATTVDELRMAHPALKLWKAWASKDGSLGGAYGKAFNEQYRHIIHGLINDPLSTHHRMTTLIPEKFPMPGFSYNKNVEHGLFSLMPCLHSYHFLSDGEFLYLHATQASGDMPIGVIPHNAYQVQFMLLLTAYLTDLKPAKVVHQIHDAHIYENQLEAVEKMLEREPLEQRIDVKFNNLRILNFKPEWIPQINMWVKTGDFRTHPAIKIKVDS